ncbi:hypothetical protein E3U44_14690 [Nitrosococcus wardiae]|uniref:PhnA-like protein n=2 Tax=Nitrosococcus wardiae TaxID=1814290 RepID=A0A4P7C252_9GAMM|nr:hypothetical protein E3U44_14690 [Nitrosococcus wardiae]
MDHVERTVTTVEHPGQINWGAVIAGLVVVISVSWLMVLLGSAIGLSIADTFDSKAMEEGLGWGSIIWLLLTALVTFFLGGWFAGRLADKTVKIIGMLHGVTVWGVSIILLIFLGYAGIAGLMQTGSALLSGGAAVVPAAAVGATAETDNGATSPFVTQIQAQLKRQASEITARTAEEGVSPEEVERAIEQLDAQTLQAAAMQLLQGNTQAAKDVLAVNTNLSEAEINAIINGVEQEVQQRLDTIATYTQAILWATFISSLLGLAMAIIGGWIGASRVRRFYAIQQRATGT